MPGVDVRPNITVDPSGKNVIFLKKSVEGRFVQISVKGKIELPVFMIEPDGCPGCFVPDEQLFDDPFIGTQKDVRRNRKPILKGQITGYRRFPIRIPA